MSYIYGYVGGSGVISGGCTDWVGTKMTEKLKDGVMGVRPLPCVRDEHGEIKEQTVKDLFTKINEELDELKETVYFSVPGDFLVDYVKPEAARERISEEAADTITAITTLCEALGIDAAARDEAQRRVNEKNRSRGRL